jgi:hypothetical protein
MGEAKLRVEFVNSTDVAGVQLCIQEREDREDKGTGKIREDKIREDKGP